MVTLQVKIELFLLCWVVFGAEGKQERGRELCAPALNFHLQCYRLRCFGFARQEAEPAPLNKLHVGNYALSKPAARLRLPEIVKYPISA